MNPKSTQQIAAGQPGFTLIELLIAITIVGILAAIAVPSYVDYLRRGAAEEGTAALANGRVSLEQYYLDNKQYSGAGSPCPADTDKFTIKCEPDVDKYTITATGSGNMASFIYTIDQSGLRTTDGPWGTANCWITKKGGSC